MSKTNFRFISFRCKIKKYKSRTKVVIKKNLQNYESFLKIPTSNSVVKMNSELFFICINSISIRTPNFE